VGDLTSELKTLLRQEVALAKTEMSEKASKFGRNAVSLAIGGFVAYAGLIVLLIGLGVLLAWAFVAADMSPFLAGFLGLAIIGLLVALIGGAFIAKALKTMKKESLAPQRTIHTLHELRGTESAKGPQYEPAKQTSEQIQNRVEETEHRMGETLDELGRRLSPRHINAQVKQRIQERPYHAGLIAIVAGVVSGFFLKNKFRRA